jgi:hypothetical protein
VLHSAYALEFGTGNPTRPFPERWGYSTDPRVRDRSRVLLHPEHKEAASRDAVSTSAHAPSTLLKVFRGTLTLESAYDNAFFTARSKKVPD